MPMEKAHLLEEPMSEKAEQFIKHLEDASEALGDAISLSQLHPEVLRMLCGPDVPRTEHGDADSFLDATQSFINGIRKRRTVLEELDDIDAHAI